MKTRRLWLAALMVAIAGMGLTFVDVTSLAQAQQTPPQAQAEPGQNQASPAAGGSIPVFKAETRLLGQQKSWRDPARYSRPMPPRWGNSRWLFRKRYGSWACLWERSRQPSVAISLERPAHQGPRLRKDRWNLRLAWPPKTARTRLVRTAQTRAVFQRRELPHRFGADFAFF